MDGLDWMDGLMGGFRASGGGGAGRQTDRQANRLTETDIIRQTDRQTETGRDRQTDRVDGWIDRLTD